MKAFLAALIGIAAIAVGVHYGLDSLGMSAREVYSLDGVSPPPPPVDRPAFQ